LLRRQQFLPVLHQERCEKIENEELVVQADYSVPEFEDKFRAQFVGEISQEPGHAVHRYCAVVLFHIVAQFWVVVLD